MNKKSGESSRANRISSLPRDLLQKILGCLPLHDDDLKHLELNSCEFNPPPNFKGFRSLPMSFQVLLSSSPLLERVSMVCCSEFDSFIIEAPNLRIFKFSSTTNSLCFRRTPLLKEIVLGMPFNMSEVEWVAHVLDLINRCPNIERLLITQLKSLDMTLMWVNKTEMEFLKHVLAYATALEKIYIATSAEICHRGMKMMEEMKQFPRASPNVEFIYRS
ncbi:hypothetical protein R3W88_021084 [Solanum pinnatisectum]|uniref:FBD domain-containing protein n=1 Tax=Solanum pinnatisectum TaxID=50273 RepID=A0AAV9LQT3_9SOLN|nr:hypothetical protein R3W88_021084 [Solanum pinnatisectum]